MMFEMHLGRFIFKKNNLNVFKVQFRSKKRVHLLYNIKMKKDH